MKLQNEYVPCILKNDAIERKITCDIFTYLSRRVLIQKVGEFVLSREDVISYKKDEWLNDTMGEPVGLFKDCILDYEAAHVMLLKIHLSEGMTYDDLTTIKGRHFLPHKCAWDSIRGHFRDEGQSCRLLVIQERILELLPNGQIGFPRNIIHIPDCEKSALKLRNLIEQKMRIQVTI